jgi:hypothetical protein
MAKKRREPDNLSDQLRAIRVPSHDGGLMVTQHSLLLRQGRKQWDLI